MIFDAIRQGDADRVRALLAADPALYDARTPEGATVVQWAVYTGHSELASTLLATREPDFFEACALGRIDRVAELVAADPGIINAASSDGFGGLGLACFFRHAEVARLLLDRGADPGQASANGLRVSPLHSAVAANLPEVIGWLLDRGADPNAREASGYTPLHNACGQGNREVIARLLAAGADPGARANDGKTPADVARQYGHAEVVELLG